MNHLLRQAGDPAYTRGRSRRLRVHYARQRIAYRAPNGMVFHIDTSRVEEGGEPRVYTLSARDAPPSHATHTNGNSRVCLAVSLRGWDLTRILFQCDSWARGCEIYRRTGHFPDTPLESFNPAARRTARRPASLFIRLLERMLP